MASDVTVILEDRPGTLALLGQALGDAGINMDGIAGFPCAGAGVVHLLVEDGERARTALVNAGLEVRETREVLLLDVENRPGALGAVARRLADAGINIDLCYPAGENRLALGVDDLEKARSAV